MLSKARSLYTRLKTSLHVHSSLRTTTGGTATSFRQFRPPAREGAMSTPPPLRRRSGRHEEGRDAFILTAVDDRQLLEDVVGVAVVVVDQQRPHRRLRRVLPLGPPHHEMARGRDPTRGGGGGHWGWKVGQPRRRLGGEAECGHRGGPGGARAGSGWVEEREKGKGKAPLFFLGPWFVWTLERASSVFLMVKSE